MMQAHCYKFGLISWQFVAKYIGPENFGKLTFVETIFAILQTLYLMGTEIVGDQKQPRIVKLEKI